MIHGHGDDTYKYSGIRLNFSSNIPGFVDLSALEAHLRCRISAIRTYPEPTPQRLERLIADSIGRSAEEVLVTSGATEAIYLIAQHVSHTLPEQKRTYTAVHPTFSEYDSASQMFGLRPQQDGAVCWVCNPNNPTGTLYTDDALRALAARHRLLVVDQSYEDYTLQPPPPDGGCPGALVLHSMTKRYCIPGLRLGYITGPAPIVARLRHYCRPWAVNALAIEAGQWLLAHRPRLVDMPQYLAEAQRLRSMLNRLPGIHALETQTNFMLCTIAGCTAAQLKEHLALRHGILIRDASNFPGLTPHHFRVSAQQPEANDELVRAIAQFVGTIPHQP